MDMKKERRKVYWRCFALLLALWLVLAGVFSAYVLQDARNEEKQRFIRAANDQAMMVNANEQVQIFMDYVIHWLGEAREEGVPFVDIYNRHTPLEYRSKEAGQVDYLNVGNVDYVNRVREADSMVSAALFTRDGELLWQPAKPGTIGAPDTMGWLLGGIPDFWQEHPYNLTDFFDSSALEEIYRTLVPAAGSPTPSQILVEAYCDGEAVYPLSIKVGDYQDGGLKVIASAVSTRNLPDTPENLRESTAFNGNTPKSAQATPGGRWLETGRLDQDTAVAMFEAMFNGSARLEDIASDPSGLEEAIEDPIQWGYLVADDTVKESAWNLLDRVYTAQVRVGTMMDRDTETGRLTAQPAGWLQLAGRSDVWSVAGNYWLATVLISLGGFLAAAWLLAYTTWRGQRSHLLYERRTRETTAALAHDLKTPLAVIRACVENLAEGIHPEKESYYTEEITRQTAIMDHALLDMLELSRMDRPSAPLKLEETGWRELLEGRLEALSPLLAELEVTVEAEGMVRADLAQLERLTDNLLRNALEHSDGVVRVQADSRGLHVYNSGAPIPEEDLPRIWEPYFKGDAARKGGSGLGLALVSAIAKAHGWTCEAKNTESGVEVSILYE